MSKIAVNYPESGTYIHTILFQYTRFSAPYTVHHIQYTIYSTPYTVQAVQLIHQENDAGIFIKYATHIER